MTLRNDVFFFIFGQLIRHLLMEFFTFPVCFICQMTVEWSTVSSSATSHVVVKRISLNDPLGWSLPNSDRRPLCSSSSRLSLLETPPHCMFVSNSRDKCVVVEHCLHCFATYFELEQKIAQICFFSNPFCTLI